jgi:hypothetical protein
MCLSAIACLALGQLAGSRATAPEIGERAHLVHRVYHVAIQLAPNDIQELQRDSRAYVPARVQMDGATFDEVGIHLKGRGTFQALDAKPSLTLDFERFHPGRRLEGMRQIHLNNSAEDPAYAKEWIATDLFRRAGIPVPDVAHAVVTLNGRGLGLYVLKEGFTEEFFARVLGWPNGRLYESETGQEINGPLKVRVLGQVTNQTQSIGQLIRAVREPDLAKRWVQLEQWLDVKEVVRLMAMEVMMCHWDGYSLSRNNFRIFEPVGGLLILLPTGMDQVFANRRLDWQPSMAGSIARAIIETPEGRTLYAVTFRQLFAEQFSVARMNSQVDAVISSLRPEVSSREFQQIRREGSELGARIAQRAEYLKQALERPPPTILEVPDGGTRVEGWEKADPPPHGAMEEGIGPGGRVVLHIQAGGKAAASWRTKVRLGRGRYRFSGEVRVKEVQPLPFGKNQGASLRVLGMPGTSSRLLGTCDWRELSARFEIRQAIEEVELVCELRASAGEAWFATDSLLIRRER